jgi:hypothetical protein
MKYLKEQSSQNKFPEYNNPGTGVDVIVPDSETYTTQVWLGDDYCCAGKSFEEMYQGNSNSCCGK